MFGRQDDSGTRTQSIIQEGVSVRGEIKAEGDVRLDGSLEGKVTTQSRVIVGTAGSLVADIEAAEVLVMGKVIGNIRAVRRIELRKGAHVEGDLSTESLAIEEGVFFQGLSQMGPAAGRGDQEPDSKSDGDSKPTRTTDIFSAFAQKSSG